MRPPEGSNYIFRECWNHMALLDSSQLSWAGFEPSAPICQLHPGADFGLGEVAREWLDGTREDAQSGRGCPGTGEVSLP